MSRPYHAELAVLPEVYAAAREGGPSGRSSVLSPVLGPGHSSSLLAVGSGGSGTVARYVADIHRAATGAVTRAVTPLEVLSGPQPPRGTRVVLISAGGSNTDVLAAWRIIAGWDDTERVVMCGVADSPLAAAARGENVDVVSFERHGEESFVACASVLAPAVLAVRGLGAEIPDSYAELVAPMEKDLETLGELWEREVVVALHGTDTAAAAAGLESNFTEAGLGPVMVSDFRNFAHGRYLWLEREASRTTLLTVESDTDRALADESVRVVGERVPTGRVRMPGAGAVAGLRAIAAVLEMTGAAGVVRGIDPAQPGSDPFGPALYGLEVPEGPGT